MRALSFLFILAALLSLLFGVIWRLAGKPFPLGGGIPPQSFLEFTIVCLLFSIVITMHRNK